MATLNGILQSGSQFSGLNSNLSSDGFDFDLIMWPYTRAIDSFNRGASSVTRKLNVSVPAKRAVNGFVTSSYFLDYYFRVHINPSTVNLGDVITNQIRDVEVWNANFTARRLNSIAIDGDGSGVTLIEPAPAPTTFAINESRVYKLTATLGGSPTIDVKYAFNFDGQTPKLAVTGRRVVLFPYAPNFDRPLVETLEWKTDVMRAYSGKEQRRALINTPRRSFEFNIQVKGEETQYWHNLLWGWQTRMFTIPIWTDRTTLKSAVTSGAMIIECDTTNLAFVVGGVVAIFASEHNNEMVEVESFNATSITVKRPIAGNWDKGVSVYPCVFAHMPVEVNVTRHTSDKLESRCVFQTSPDVTDPFTPTASAPTIYDGLEVITVQPNWVNGLGQNMSNQFATIDLGVGQIRWLQKELNSSKALPYSWLLKDRAAIAAFRSFLGRQKGRLKTCWIPSWTDDFTIIQTMQSGDLIMPVKDNAFGRMVGVNPALNRIMVRLKSGQVFYRKITNITLAADNINIALVLDSPFGIKVDVADVVAIHFLHRCRFATDKFDLQWYTDRVVTVDSNFTSVDQ